MTSIQEVTQVPVTHVGQSDVVATDGLYTQIHWWISYIGAIHYVCGIPFQISGKYLWHPKPFHAFRKLRVLIKEVFIVYIHKRSCLENDKVYDDLHSYLAPLEKMTTFDIHSITPLLELIKIDLDDFKFGSPTFKTVLVAMRLLDHIISRHAKAPKGIFTFSTMKVSRSTFLREILRGAAACRRMICFSSRLISIRLTHSMLMFHFYTS